MSRFWGVFWIDASSPRNAERAFSELGRLGGMEEKFESGMYWLAGLEKPWLLVIDNADDSEFDYARYFPSGDRGHILVTSRNPECRIHATIGYYEFKEMEPEDAVTLLLRAANEKDLGDRRKRDLAGPIAKTLGFLPLALIQAGASITKGICPLEKYLDVFASHKRAIMNTRLIQGAEDYKYTVYTTWEVSFQKIANQATEAAVDAIEILHILAFLHFEQVPAAMFETAWNNVQGMKKPKPSESMIERAVRTYPIFRLFLRRYERVFPPAASQLPRILLHAGSEWDHIRFRQALFILSSYSLIFKDISNDSYSMHPMVHFWARERLQAQEQKLWSEVTRCTIAYSINAHKGTSNTIYRRSLLPHIDSCLQGEHSARLIGLSLDGYRLGQLTKFAAVYSEGGRWNEARELQEQVVDVRTKILGSKHPETLQAMASLAWSYWNLSQMANALKIQRTVMESSLEILGPEDPMTLRAMDSLARTYWLCGKTASAEELGRQSVDGMIQILGSGHPHTLGAMHNLARALMHLGRPKDAQKMQLEVLSARAKMLGTEHLDTLATMAELGMSCLALGQVNEAEKFVANVLEGRKRILGHEHAYTLWSINDLSKVYCAQGYAKNAVELLVKTREVAIRTLGSDHIGTFMTTFNLAHAYRCQQRWVDAETLLSALIEMELRILDPLHPDVLVAKLELGLTWKQQGYLDKAEPLLLEVTKAMKEKMGADHPRTLKAQGQLHELYKAAGRIDEASGLETDSLDTKSSAISWKDLSEIQRGLHRASTT
jgi:hypothetical protein